MLPAKLNGGRRWADTLLLAGLPALGVACAGSVVSSEEDEAQIRDRLYVSAADTQRDRVLKVCWSVDGWDHEKEVVRKAVEDTWMRFSQVRVTGWDRCWTLSPIMLNDYDIRIREDDVQPVHPGLGGSSFEHMILNFRFNAWPSVADGFNGGTNDGNCNDDQAHRDHCIRLNAVHEFGHALGFAHEQNRPGAPPCERNGSNGNWTPTEYDSWSVMNYCHEDERWSNWGELSTLDIVGVQAVYGSRPAASDTVWGQGNPEVELLGADKGICALTQITGSFKGLAERVSLLRQDGWRWKLGGSSAQHGVGARARCARARRLKSGDLWLRDVLEISTRGEPGATARATLPAGSACFLASVSGELRGAGERVAIQNGELTITSGAGIIDATARCVRGLPGAVTTAEWTQGQPAIRLPPATEALCGLSGISGDFAGAEEIIVSEINGQQFLTGYSGTRGVWASATCVSLIPLPPPPPPPPTEHLAPDASLHHGLDPHHSIAASWIERAILPDVYSVSYRDADCVSDCLVLSSGTLPATQRSFTFKAIPGHLYAASVCSARAGKTLCSPELTARAKNIVRSTACPPGTVRCDDLTCRPRGQCDFQLGGP